jgi:hypothetical protein
MNRDLRKQILKEFYDLYDTRDILLFFKHKVFQGVIRKIISLFKATSYTVASTWELTVARESGHYTQIYVQGFKPV